MRCTYWLPVYQTGVETSADSGLKKSSHAEDKRILEDLRTRIYMRFVAAENNRTPFPFLFSASRLYVTQVRNTAKKRRSLSEPETDAVWQPEKVGLKGVRNSTSGRKSLR